MERIPFTFQLTRCMDWQKFGVRGVDFGFGTSITFRIFPTNLKLKV